MNEDTRARSPLSPTSLETPVVEDAAVFWNEFLGRLMGETEASMITVWIEDKAQWKRIRSAVSQTRRGGEEYVEFREAGEELVKQFGPDGSLETAFGSSGQARVVGRLFSGHQGSMRGAIFLLFLQPERVRLAKACGILKFAVVEPRTFDLSRRFETASNQVERAFRVVDAVSQILPRQRFAEAAITLCNTVATDLGAEQVFLGWEKGSVARVVAISRTESFNRKMALVELIEKAMDECLDQGCSVMVPAPGDADYVSYAHEEAVRKEPFGNLLSVPLQKEGQTIGVITVQRSASPFSKDEMERIEIISEMVSPRLGDLQRTDRWFGARICSGIKQLAGRFLGPTHTWTKIGAIAGFVLLCFLIFYQTAHRIEGSLLLRSESMANLTVPFDGYLAEVLVAPGDRVEEGQLLARLDEEEIRLERDAAAAELERFRREAERARVARETADMRIAEAMAGEALARFELANHRLRRTEIRAPVSGFILEGDLRERVDAPLRQGDLLFVLASTDDLLAVARIAERDVHFVRVAAPAELALVARPEERFRGTVEVLEPSGFPGEAGNQFTVRIRLDSRADWWRPGMSGVVKIEAGEKPLLWILTHRTVNFLRMYFWI